MVDFGKLLKDLDRDEERGYEEQKQTVMRCPECGREEDYFGYLPDDIVDYCNRSEHKRGIKMVVVKRHIVRVPV